MPLENGLFCYGFNDHQSLIARNSQVQLLKIWLFIIRQYFFSVVHLYLQLRENDHLHKYRHVVRHKIKWTLHEDQTDPVVLSLCWAARPGVVT